MRAHTRRLPGAVDLVSFAGEDGVLWSRSGFGLAGRGEAVRLSFSLSDGESASEQVSALLGSFESSGEYPIPGSGPVAFGALPFDPAETATLVVPSVVVVRAHDGTSWMTTLGEPEKVQAPPAEPLQPPTSFRLSSEIEPQDWCRRVAELRKELGSGEQCRKVVMARAVRISCDRALSLTAIVRALQSGHPSCMLFSIGGFVGASPELLVSRLGDVVRSHPMAGTVARSPDPDHDARLADGLRWSAKDREEHQITIDMVYDALLPWCSYLDWEPEPSVVSLSNVHHLATLMEGRLSEPTPSVLELLRSLHPTPAVCGDPRNEAMAAIRRFEGTDRGRYAGPVGWVDSAGNGEWAVGIRSAEVKGSEARVFAGAGIVPDSDPAAELEETRAKLQALLSAIVRP